MNKVSLLITLIITLNTMVSCDTSNNYLAQNYTPTKNQSELIKLQSKLQKPIIVPECVGFVENDDNLLEKMEASTFVSTLNLSIDNIIYEANSYLGTPYRYGGTSRRGIDCSAFMQKIYSVEGIDLPRVSYKQAQIGIPVSINELQKGDLIFFSTTSPKRVTHVGMVVDTDDDEVKFIHAASSQGVSIASLSNAYWSRRYRTARRPTQFLNDTLVPLEEAERMVASNK